MIGFSVYLGKGQHSQVDYYVGGRNLPWWAVGISTMATQTSAISFISVPAFVALNPDGGLIWLQYELAVPLSIIAVMVTLVPFFRKMELVSVYEYLELRFSPSVRYLMSGVFLISRGLATGVLVYASGIVLSVCLDIPIWSTILIIGVVTVVYDTIGGMAAVVYSDVIQMGILIAGVIICIVYATIEVGGIETVITSFPPERWKAIDFSTGLGDGSTTPFWGFLIGSFFLYVSYYGTDQSQVQRELSAPSTEDTRRSLLFNGLARFPLTIIYTFLGISLGAVLLVSPELKSLVPKDRLDYMVPLFILHHLPTGIKAILFAAILAASMSSLDSALNSLSAATMNDFIRGKNSISKNNILILSKLTTVLWGIAITGFAFLVGNISPTVIESINKIGSAFYGPILAAFLSGILSKRATSTAVFTGVITGVGFNLFLWIALPDVFWMWWNVFGLMVSITTTLIISLVSKAPGEETAKYTLIYGGTLKHEKKWIKWYLLLGCYSVFIFIFMVLISRK